MAWDKAAHRGRRERPAAVWQCRDAI